MVLVSSTIIEEIEAMRKNMASHHSPCFTTILRRMKRRTSVGRSHRCYSGFVTSRIPTTMSFPLSIRHTARAHKAPVTTNLSNVLLYLPGQALVYLIVDALDECPSTSALSSPATRSYRFWRTLLAHNSQTCVYASLADPRPT
jgi:hypothetical protein